MKRFYFYFYEHLKAIYIFEFCLNGLINQQFLFFDKSKGKIDKNFELNMKHCMVLQALWVIRIYLKLINCEEHT